ncbi:hypothetical protein BV22DRAFT_884103 [Leucogyrophana mollusca]|uniref:Uncharacterized protein n=1 Tax=Leucogyrophana mollusca TaxID=85980 RepID=A0ACB8AZS2_9AGAM|nr:hypothetical protein BV22DRAFT_884103 [Leucogyrophana mollusca]
MTSGIPSHVNSSVSLHTSYLRRSFHLYRKSPMAHMARSLTSQALSRCRRSVLSPLLPSRPHHSPPTRLLLHRSLCLSHSVSHDIDSLAPARQARCPPTRKREVFVLTRHCIHLLHGSRGHTQYHPLVTHREVDGRPEIRESVSDRGAGKT